MIASPTTRPSDSAVPRWMQRSRRACGVPVESRHRTRSWPSNRTRSGASPSAWEYATGCRHLPSAAKSGTEAGGDSSAVIGPMLGPLPVGADLADLGKLELAGHRESQSPSLRVVAHHPWVGTSLTLGGGPP